MNKTKSLICILSILLNITTALYFTYKIFNRYIKDKDVESIWFHLSRKSLFETLPASPGNHEIVFLGASIIQYCEWHELFGAPNILNRGIAGDCTQDIVKRLNEVIARNPSQVFIMAGLNDLMQGHPIASIEKNFQYIIKKISRNAPQTKIFVLSILPVAKTIYGSKQLNSVIADTNNRISLIAVKAGHRYIDLFDPLKDKNGFLYESFTHDGIHLTGLGYHEIKILLHHYVKEIGPDDTPKETLKNRYPDEG